MVMMLYNTIPSQKMPDDEVIQDHIYRAVLRLYCKTVTDMHGYQECVLDLREYYEWTKDNDIFMEHNLLRQGRHDLENVIMFVFENEEDAMAFKLRWK